MELHCPKQCFVNFVSRCSRGGLSRGCNVMHISQIIRWGASRPRRGINECRLVWFQYCRLERHSIHDSTPTMLKISLQVRLRQVSASGSNQDVISSKMSFGRFKSRMLRFGSFWASCDLWRYEGSSFLARFLPLPDGHAPQ